MPSLYTITPLPILREGKERPLTPFRKRDNRGKSSVISVNNAGYIAYLECVPDGNPRGNHFHRIKTEYI